MLHRRWGMHLPQGAVTCPVGLEKSVMAESALGCHHDMGFAAVCFGEDADAQFTVNRVGGFESITGLQGSVVRLQLRIGDVSPIAAGVALEVWQRIEAAFPHHAVDAGAENKCAYRKQQGTAVAGGRLGCHGRAPFVGYSGHGPVGGRATIGWVKTIACRQIRWLSSGS